MDESTREAAVEKLEGMDYQVGYPEGWPGLAKYGSLTLTEGSFFEKHRDRRKGAFTAGA